MDDSRNSTRVAVRMALVAAVLVSSGTARAQGVRSTPTERRNVVEPSAAATRPATSPTAVEPREPVPFRDASQPRLTLKRPDTAKTDAATPSRPASPWWTVLALFLVVGLVLTLARIWRKTVPGASTQLPAQAVEVLGRRPLAPRESIQLVRIGSRILVLGSSAEGLRPLAEIDDPVEVDYLAGMCRAAHEESPVIDSFRDWFRRATTRSDGTTAEGSTVSATRKTPTASRGEDDLRQRLSQRMQRPSPQEASRE